MAKKPPPGKDPSFSWLRGKNDPKPRPEDPDGGRTPKCPKNGSRTECPADTTGCSAC